MMEPVVGAASQEHVDRSRDRRAVACAVGLAGRLLVGHRYRTHRRPGDETVIDAAAARLVDLATRQVRGASAYAPDGSRNMATNVCQVLASGAGVSAAVNVLDNYSQIAPQERETIARLPCSGFNS